MSDQEQGAAPAAPTMAPPPGGPPDAVLSHVDRAGRADVVGMRKVIDEAVALMKLPTTHPPAVMVNVLSPTWRFVAPRTTYRYPQATRNFPASHALAGQDRYRWYRIEDTLYAGYLRPEAIEHAREVQPAGVAGPPVAVEVVTPETA